MLIGIHWSEWLRRIQVDRFDAPSAIVVEDFYQRELANDRTAYVFDDTDRPMLQCLESQWGNGRYNTKQLAEIHNALAPEQTVAKFKNREAAIQALSIQLTKMGRVATPYLISNTSRSDMPDTNTKAGAAGDANVKTSDIKEAKASEPDGAEAAAAAAQQTAESAAEQRAATAARKRAEKEEAKAAAKAKRDADKIAAKQKKEDEKVAAKAAKPPGVIDTIQALLLDGTKRTAEGIYNELLKKFPDRGEAMLTTVRVQLVRMPKERPIRVHSEDRVDTEGKKLAGKNYWGEKLEQKAA